MVALDLHIAGGGGGLAALAHSAQGYVEEAGSHQKLSDFFQVQQLLS